MNSITKSLPDALLKQFKHNYSDPVLKNAMH